MEINYRSKKVEEENNRIIEEELIKQQDLEREKRDKIMSDQEIIDYEISKLIKIKENLSRQSKNSTRHTRKHSENRLRISVERISKHSDS